MARPIRAYIGLGANIGDPAETIARAIEALDSLEETRVGAISRLFRTSPVGVTDQPDFYNAVVALDLAGTDDPRAGALQLLRRLKAIEARFGRQPGRRWGPRILDLDLLLYARERIRVERPPDIARRGEMEGDLSAGPPPKLLEVPHRDVADRLFVLAPLADLAPELVPPGWQETVETARRRREAAEGPRAARPVASWDPDSRGWRPLEG